MITDSSLSAASTTAAPGGILLDGPAAIASDASDFNAAMTKAANDADTPHAHLKPTKTASAKNGQSAMATARPAKTVATVRVDGKKIATAITSASQAAKLVTNPSDTTGAPVKLGTDGLAIAQNADDIKTETDPAKKAEADEEDDDAALASLVSAPTRSSDTDSSKIGVLLAYLSQAAPFPKDLAPLKPLPVSGNSDSDTADGDTAIFSGGGSVTGDAAVSSNRGNTNLVGSSLLPGVVTASTTQSLIPPLISTASTPTAVPLDPKTSKDSAKVDAKSPLIAALTPTPKAIDASTDSVPTPKTAAPNKSSTPLGLAPVVTTLDNPKPVSQLIVNQAHAGQIAQLNSLLPRDGTGVALNSQSMKFATEKNEIAGREGQKVPTATTSSSNLSDTAVRAVAGAGADSSASNRQSWDFSSRIDFSDVIPSAAVALGKTSESLTPATQSATQAERIGHLVSSQVVTLRESGANSLAVSLKVDQHTELFLQLSNHNGQVQASVSLERGNAASLEPHWNDLQQSLAKQNIQLMPLDDKSAMRTPVATTVTPPAGSSNNFSNFDQSSQNSTRQNRNGELEHAFETVGSSKEAAVKTKTKRSNPQGWESWA